MDIDVAKIQSIVDGVAMLEGRMDASASMLAFQERQAARKRAAQEGEAQADRLLERCKAAIKALKKSGESLNPGRASNAERNVKRARSCFSLAIGAMSESSKFDDWMAKGKHEIAEAENDVRSLEEQAARSKKDAAEKQISLWKYNKRSGYWDHERSCSEENAQQWLRQFSSDAPNETFKLSKNRPAGRPAERKDAVDPKRQFEEIGVRARRKD